MCKGKENRLSGTREKERQRDQEKGAENGMG